MKTISDDLRAILASSTFDMADCYTFILASGQVIRRTTADYAIIDAATGNVFLAASGFFERSKLKFKTGVELDALSIVVKAGPGDAMWTGGPDWLPGLRGGVLDGAEVQVNRAFMPAPGDTSAGLVTMFYGRVTELNAGRTQATIKANTHLELPNLQWPWRLFQAGCSRTLFDVGCTLVKPAPGTTGSSLCSNCTIQSGSSLTTLNTDLAQAGGWASAGTLTFTSGALSGASYSIKYQVVGGVISMLVPLPELPAIGDTLTVYPGCDKTRGTCQNKFNNLLHFEGFPFTPVPETAA